jgi:hypothetical protein
VKRRLGQLRTSRPVFFFHLPKTAGTTLHRILSAEFREADICPANNWTELLEMDQEALAGYRLFKGHFYGELSGFLGRRPYTFTLLRDPVERALSHYGHVMRDPAHYFHRRAVELGSLDAYLADPVTRMTVSNFQTRLLALNALPQEIFHGLSAEQRKAGDLERQLETVELDASSSQVLARAQRRLSEFGFVGFTERFEESVALLCYELGWTFPEHIADENINSARLKRSEVSDSSLRLLLELNQLDLELYRRASVIFRERMKRMFSGLLQHNEQSLLRKLARVF